MGNISFILGGTRSGKSNFAVKQVESINKKTAYIATCEFYDNEMNERIELHKKERPSCWQTFEEPVNIALLLKKIDSDYEVVLIDCLTLLVSNLLCNDTSQDDINKKIKELMITLKNAKFKAFIVSNEVGLGVVPENALARKFRDVAGKANQIVAEYSDEVTLVVSGIPMKIK